MGPDFLPPCGMRFSHVTQGKGPFQGIRFKMSLFPLPRGKNCVSQGLENRGSPISAPLALRAQGYSRRLSGGFSVEAHKPHSRSFSGRFGSHSAGLPGCTVCAELIAKLIRSAVTCVISLRVLRN